MICGVGSIEPARLPPGPAAYSRSRPEFSSVWLSSDPQPSSPEAAEPVTARSASACLRSISFYRSSLPLSPAFCNRRAWYRVKCLRAEWLHDLPAPRPCASTGSNTGHEVRCPVVSGPFVDSAPARRRAAADARVVPLTVEKNSAALRVRRRGSSLIFNRDSSTAIVTRKSSAALARCVRFPWSERLSRWAARTSWCRRFSYRRRRRGSRP